MAHKILVLSPLHNIGTTSVAALINQGLTFDNKESTIMFTRNDSVLPQYLGIQSVQDPTRSIMQIVRLIDNGALEDQDILDYAYVYAKNSYMMNVADPSLTERDKSQILDHIYSRIPTDVIVCDNSEPVESDMTARLIEACDMIFIVVNTYVKCKEFLNLWMQMPIFKQNKSKVFLVVNQYDETVSALRNIARIYNFPANRVCKIHYNPWISKCCMSGQLHTILPLARELDPRVANLNTDINELIMCINSSMFMNSKKGL